MKIAFAAILLIASTVSWASGPEPNAADYTIDVHVQASGVDTVCSSSGCAFVQRLAVLVNGKSYELLSAETGHPYLLKLGDYRARISKTMSDQPYEYYTVYEFLFAGAKTQTYAVVGEHEQ